MFSDKIQLFDGKFAIGKTYAITNAKVVAEAMGYEQVNNKIQLNFEEDTNVKEVEDNPMPNISYTVKDYSDIESNMGKLIDIAGFLADVKPFYQTKQQAQEPGYRRDIYLMNQESKIQKVILWDDLAKIDGDQLERAKRNRVIIVISNVKVKQYLGETQLQTNAASTIDINPSCNETKKLLECPKNKWDGEEVKQLATPEIAIDDVFENVKTLIQGKKYYFKGTIKEVKVKSTPWYPSCNVCKKKWNGTTTGPCLNCGQRDTTEIPRYRLNLDIVSGNHQVYAVLFDKAVEQYVGCSAEEYIEAFEKDKLNSRWYKRLNWTESKEGKFYFKFYPKNVEHTKFSPIVDDVELLDKELECQIVAEHGKTKEQGHEIATVSPQTPMKRERKAQQSKNAGAISEQEEKIPRINLDDNDDEDDDEANEEDEKLSSFLQKRIKKKKI